MRWLTTVVLLAVGWLAAGLLAAGCTQGGTLKNAAASLSPRPSVTFSPPTFSPKPRSPRPTREPVTREPVTKRPEASPSAAAPVPPPASSAAPAQAPAENGTGSALPWLLLGLAVLAIVVTTVLIARRSGRRAATAATWRSRLVDTSAKGSALYDSMAMAESPDVWGAEDAGLRWAEIQRRADDLTQDLYELRDTAPGETERARVAEALGSLQAVRSAMNAEHAPGAARASHAARVHLLLGSFEDALRQLRLPR